MAEEKNGPVDQAKEAGGDQGATSDVVSYESYQKVLGEKKKVADRLKTLEQDFNSLQSRMKEEEEAKLTENEKWKEAYTKAKEEIESLTGKITTYEQKQVNAVKLNSFFKALGSQVDQRYWDLIDIDKIAMEGDGVDEFSVGKYVEEFKSSYPEVIQIKESRKMPDDSPSPAGTGKLTYEQWQQLPRAEKESRINDVVMN